MSGVKRIVPLPNPPRTSDAGPTALADYFIEMHAFTHNVKWLRMAVFATKPKGGRPPTSGDAEIVAEIRDFIEQFPSAEFERAYREVMRTRESAWSSDDETKLRRRIKRKFHQNRF